jgi:hypothetical protein
MIKTFNSAISNALSKTDEFYQTLIGQDPFTPEATIIDSEDINCGALCNELEFARVVSDYYVESLDLDLAEDDNLESLVAAFIDLPRRSPIEADAAYRLRFKFIVVQKSNSKRTTRWAILDAISYFIADMSTVQILEFFSTKNLVTDSDDLTTSNWTKSNATAVLTGTSVWEHALNTCTETAASGKIYQDVGKALAVTQEFQAIVRRGTATSTSIEYSEKLTPFTVRGSIKITWATDTIVATVGSLSYTEWIDDDTVFIAGKTTATCDVLKDHNIILNVDVDGSNGYMYATAFRVENPTYVPPYFQIRIEGATTTDEILFLNNPEQGYLDNEFVGGPGIGAIGTYLSDLVDRIRAAGVNSEVLFVDQTQINKTSNATIGTVQFYKTGDARIKAPVSFAKTSDATIV